MSRQRDIRSRLRTAAISMVFLAGPLVATAAAQEAVSFKDDVFPVLEIRCVSCHVPGGAGYEASGLDLGSYDGLMKGTKFGPVVTPGNWIESSLAAVIDRRSDPEIWMPHNRKPLSKCEKLLVRFWIMQGAKEN